MCESCCWGRIGRPARPIPRSCRRADQRGLVPAGTEIALVWSAHKSQRARRLGGSARGSPARAAPRRSGGRAPPPARASRTYGGPLHTIEQKESRQAHEPQQRSQQVRHQIHRFLRVHHAGVLDRRSSSRRLELPTAGGQQVEKPVGVGSVGERRQSATLDRKREDGSAMATSGLSPHVVDDRQRRHEGRHRRYQPVGEFAIDAAHEAGSLHARSIEQSRSVHLERRFRAGRTGPHPRRGRGKDPET